MTDEKLRNSYFNKVKGELQKIDEKSLKGMVDQEVLAYFEKAYLDKIQTVQKKCDEAQDLVKRRNILNLKRFFI